MQAARRRESSSHTWCAGRWDHKTNHFPKGGKLRVSDWASYERAVITSGLRCFPFSFPGEKPTMQTLMPTCFVIQPFDADKFDKRFEEVFSPAIQAAGLDPYRVDRDPSVDVPIDAIESGIRGAAVCLADITTDNPNVWYELGFAFAAGRPVVMVCSQER